MEKTCDAFIYHSQYTLAATPGVWDTVRDPAKRAKHQGVVDRPFDVPDTRGYEALSIRPWWQEERICVSWWRSGLFMDGRTGHSWTNYSIVLGMEEYKALHCCPAALETLYRTEANSERIDELVVAQIALFRDPASLSNAPPRELACPHLPPEKHATDALLRLDFQNWAGQYRPQLVTALDALLAGQKLHVVTSKPEEERRQFCYLLTATLPPWREKPLTLITVEPRGGLWHEYDVVLGGGGSPEDEGRVSVYLDTTPSAVANSESGNTTPIVDLISGHNIGWTFGRGIFQGDQPGIKAVWDFYSMCQDMAKEREAQPQSILELELAKAREDQPGELIALSKIAPQEAKAKVRSLSALGAADLINHLRNLPHGFPDREGQAQEWADDFFDAKVEKEGKDALCELYSEESYRGLREHVPRYLAVHHTLCNGLDPQQPGLKEAVLGYVFDKTGPALQIEQYVRLAPGTEHQGLLTWYPWIKRLTDPRTRKETAYRAGNFFVSGVQEMLRSPPNWDYDQVGRLAVLESHTVELLRGAGRGAFNLEVLCGQVEETWLKFHRQAQKARSQPPGPNGGRIRLWGRQ